MEGDLLLCARCDAPHDADDNYCRRCGAYLRAGLPATRDSEAFATTVWEPRVPAAVVKGAAAVAAGALARMALRTLIGRALRSRPRPKPAGRAIEPVEESPLPDGVRFISETLIVRRVRIRG
ncbi:MAG TPA: hypothetical protein VNN12_03210 [Dehalococcoidia bacterium]|nr:hypothetical protein [Dehalococcoidia bacterium]